MLGYKFRRQHGIGKYIVDFYCPQLSLVIEVDGDTHYYDSGRRHDFERDRYMKKLGIQTMRFTNPEVIDNLEGVLYALEMKIKELESGIKKSNKTIR